MTGEFSRAAQPYVAVIGPSDATETEAALAYEVGREIALRGGVVVCGGLGGVMEAAARGAREALVDPPATIVGILPGTDRQAGNDYLTVALATGLGELRNGVLVSSSDAVIAVGGNPGTLIEMGFALHAGKPLAVVAGWSVLAAGGQLAPGMTMTRSAASALDAVLGPR